MADMPSTSGYVYPNANVDPLAVNQLNIGGKSVDNVLNQAPAGILRSIFNLTIYFFTRYICILTCIIKHDNYSKYDY